MPHQCLRCNFIYGDDSQEILKGCSNLNKMGEICRNRAFLYMKKLPDKTDDSKSILDKEQKDKIVKEIQKEIEIDGNSLYEQPIILKLENINVLEDGKYEIDINGLMKDSNNLPIFKVGDGTYLLDIKKIHEKD